MPGLPHPLTRSGGLPLSVLRFSGDFGLESCRGLLRQGFAERRETGTVHGERILASRGGIDLNDSPERFRTSFAIDAKAGQASPEAQPVGPKLIEHGSSQDTMRNSKPEEKVASGQWPEKKTNQFLH
jgi:hypothetical protein